jgi:hypothetical protein
MPDEENELDRLDPESAICKLSTDFAVEIVRLRTRQFFRLLRVLTHGAGPAVVQSGLDFAAGQEAFVQQLLMLVVMSIPDAEQEAIGFLQSMCRPTGLAERPKLSKQEEQDNQALWDRFNKELFNPELTDTIDLIEVIVRQEAPELQALGKKLERVFKMFRATGQDKAPAEPEPSQEELAAASQASSPSPSTSSATSTDGRTSTSSTSRSAASGRSPKQPAAASSTSG